MKNKKILLILVLVFVLLIGGAYMLYNRLGQEVTPDQLAVQESPAQSDEEERAAVKAPDFTVYDREGNEVHLSDFLGKPVVLNFWASWCGPCKMEMPDFHEKYLELGDEVQFLMVNATGGRETKDSAAAFISETGYTFPVFYDLDSDASMTYGAYSLPTTYFIDAQGYAVAKATGAIDGTTLQQGLDLILKQN